MHLDNLEYGVRQKSFVGKIPSVRRCMSISSNTLVPKDVRGKKLAVKSGCRGFMVAAMYLDKWHGAARFILREMKPVCVHATGEVTF